MRSHSIVRTCCFVINCVHQLVLVVLQPVHQLLPVVLQHLFANTWVYYNPFYQQVLHAPVSARCTTGCPPASTCCSEARAPRSLPISTLCTATRFVLQDNSAPVCHTSSLTGESVVTAETQRHSRRLKPSRTPGKTLIHVFVQHKHDIFYTTDTLAPWLRNSTK